MIKLIACDLDGTVLDDRKRPDTKLLETIRKLREKGIKFTFVSGRNEELLSQLIDEFEVSEPYVTNNGGNIYQNHQLIESDYLPGEYNNVIVKMLTDYDIAFRFFADEVYYGFKDTDFFRSRMPLLKNFGLKDYDPSIDLSQMRVYKITCDFADHSDRIESFIAELKQKCPKMTFVKAETNVYCANSMSATKGNALRKICDLLKMDPSKLMAFGDNGNDLSMLEMAGISVAMDNSSDDIKEKCDFVCKDNNHNGVSSFLIDYFKL